MLQGHKSKIDTETFPECSTCNTTETPENFLLNCKKYDTELVKLEKYIKKIFYKNNYHKLNIIIKDLLEESDLTSQDAVIIRKKMEEFILAMEKET